MVVSWQSGRYRPKASSAMGQATPMTSVANRAGGVSAPIVVSGANEAVVQVSQPFSGSDIVVIAAPMGQGA